MYFKRIRKDLFGADFNKHRGRAPVLYPPKAVPKVQKNFNPKSLFVTEWDIVNKEEPEPVPGEKKRKKKEEEVKLYPHHKFNYAALGKHNKKGLQSIFNEPEADSASTAISLSYFTRPNTTTDTTNQFMTPKQRQQAKDLIAAKQAQLRSILNEPTTGDTPVETPAEAEEEEEEEDEADEDEEGSDGAPITQNVDQAGSEDEQVFDMAFELPQQISDYHQISEIYRTQKKPFIERELKRAIIYDNQLDPEKEKHMKE